MASPNKKVIWSEKEVQYLMDVWGRHVEDLRRAKRNRHVYETMACELAQRYGVVRRCDEVQNKVKNLMREYRREAGRLRGGDVQPSNWRFFDKIANFFTKHEIDGPALATTAHQSDQGSARREEQQTGQYLVPFPSDSSGVTGQSTLLAVQVQHSAEEASEVERREGSKRAVPSSWKHFKRMESLLGARAALRELDDSQDTAGDEGTEDSETDRSFVIAPLEGMYADSQEEYIVPTTTDPSMPSTSGTSSADATSLRLSEVRSLADPPSSAQELLSIQIKEEVTDEQMEQESFQQPSRSPPTATVTSTPLVTFPEAISESAPILPPHPVFSTSEPAHLPSLTEPEAQPAIAAPSLDATRPPLEQTTTTGGFNRSRKRPATPWITLSATERKAKVELEILFAQRRKIEAELRKFEADERKVVAETLLLAEEMKRCEEEKKKFKAEAEFFLQEKAKSEEETKKAAAKAALLLEHKNFYVEQQKTEMVRRRMLLLEMRKMKHDLKLLQ
ncbi:uncharacterized protein LOC135388107 isoform X3 [Ornithodoros turicata]|uniref:uncharacterized protein LOC135388107 isoform X3 n=1 Tax=Ornithodoros turicata TaxID=34597 RepID=UPI0031399F73